MNNLTIFLQARTGSTRLPGKIFKTIGNLPAIKLMTDRIKQTEYGDRLFILTTTNPGDEVVATFSEQEKLPYFRGSEEDVLDRFYQAALKYQSDVIVRLTADCPLLSMEILTDTITRYHQHSDLDYYCVDGYPVGIGAVEIFTTKALALAHKESTAKYHREHVMTYLTDHPEKFQILIERCPQQFFRPDIRLTLDEEKDLELIRRVYQELEGQISLERIINLFNSKPELKNINADVKQKTQ